MQNGLDQTAINVAIESANQRSRQTASVRNHLPAIVRWIVIVPVTMALLGAEIELRLSPQLDLILTVAGIWVTWTLLSRK